MKRYLKIFLLYFQLTLEVKSLSVVWFLITLSGSFLLLLFWNGAVSSNGGSISGWNHASFTTYYLLIALASSLFVAHIEEDVAIDDINRGELSTYILRPMPYYGFKFLDELTWRVMQGFFSLTSIFIVFLIAPQFITLAKSWPVFLFAVLIAVCAYLVSFTFKMCLGLLAFWVKDINGFMQIVDIILTLSGGIIIPLVFLPSNLRLIFDVLPFSYMIYYPIVALLGKLDLASEIKIIAIQILWLFLFALLYKFLWSRGRKKFTAIGI